MNTVYTSDGFRHWVKASIPGDRTIYYNGFLMYDKEKLIQRGVSPEHFPEDIRVAQTAWWHYTYGDVILFQNKKAGFEYEYVAVKV